MYSISEQQIEFILNDIRRNGVEMEDLQLSLLDHLCCIIEQNLEENGDFEQFYFTSIKTFYKKDLKEIEGETKTLLTYKNYYVMKKVTLITGITSVSLLTLGIILKFLHLQGASFGIVLGIVLMSLIFLPLLFTLKIKEQKDTKDKVLIGLGTLAGISLSLGILFKVMHWPFANALSIGSLLILLLIFLPVYFFSGIRNPESKVNTIVSSILIITGCGLFLTLVRSPQGSKMYYIQTTKNYLRNEQLLKNERQLLQLNRMNDSMNINVLSKNKNINQLCEALKTFIISTETSQPVIDDNFESQSLWLEDSQIGKTIRDDQTANETLEKLKQSIEEYNKAHLSLKGQMLESSFSSDYDFRSSEALSWIIQIQMYLLQNERKLLASK